MQVRYCPGHGEMLAVAAFGQHSVCRECDARRVKAKARRTRQEAINIYGGVCSVPDCDTGSRLEFCHTGSGNAHRRAEQPNATLRRIVRNGAPLTDWSLTLFCHEHHVDVHGNRAVA